VEVSLISKINVIATTSFLKRGCHFGSKLTTFAVTNNLNEIVQSLPRCPQESSFAILRRANDKSPKPLRYNQFRVLQALKWLCSNNVEYSETTLNDKWLENVNFDNENDEHGDELELPFIPLDEDDFEGIIDDEDSDNTNVEPVTQFMMHCDDKDYNTEEQVQRILGGNNKAPTLTRSRGVYAADFNTVGFLQQAFPRCYPYGRGEPLQSALGKSQITGPYLRHCLCIGNQRLFQFETGFIFYSFSWKMQQKCGTLSLLADKSTVTDNNETVLTVEDATEFLRLTRNGEKASPLMSHAKMQFLLSQIKPWAQLLPGTSLYMEQQQKQLLSMVNSPLTTTLGSWIWFYTMVQNDSTSPLLYDNFVTSTQVLLQQRQINCSSSISERRLVADSLSPSERSLLLRSFPALSARLFALQHTAFFDIILKGVDRPLGHILESWLRIEFQARGTPHLHSLLNVKHNGILEYGVTLLPTATDENVAKVDAALQEVSGIVTARLQPRSTTDIFDLPLNPIEHDVYTYNEKQRSFSFNRNSFKQFKHPSLSRFNGDLDYTYDKNTDMIKNDKVQITYRRLQLHN